MKRSEKEQLVTELREKMEGAKALYYTDFTGLNVKRMTELRLVGRILPAPPNLPQLAFQKQLPRLGQ